MRAPPDSPAAPATSPAVPLPVERLNRRCRAEEIPFHTTADVAAGEEVIAQPRALAALELAMRIGSWSHNAYVMGSPGSGRHGAVRLTLAQEAGRRARPSDWCYVNRFDDPQRPRALRLPTGRAAQLKADMRELIEELRAAVPAALESESYRNRHAQIDREFEKRQEQSLAELQREAEHSQLALIQSAQGIAILPVRNGEVLDPEQFAALPEAERRERQERIEALSERLRAHMEAMPGWHRDHHRKLRELEREVTASAVRHLIEERRARYSDCPEVLDHLDKVESDLVENAGNLFRAESGLGLLAGLEKAESRARLDRYDVNVIVDSRTLDGAPVVYESNPTYQNLIGEIENVAQFGMLSTDFTMIRGGALHAANGGFLLLDAERLISQPFAWDALKHALFGRRIRIESLGQRLSLISTRTLEPEPIPLEVRVVLIGTRQLYHLLCEYDIEFAELFKVVADFDDTIDRSGENLGIYARLIAGSARREQLRPFDASAVARLVEYGSRLAGDSRKLSIHRRSLEDALRESNHFAAAAASDVVQAAHVQRALDEQAIRLGRIHARTLEAIQQEVLLIDCDGEAVGQVNALSVIQVGTQPFGQPSRITAVVRIGEGEVLDIEREVRLGGAIHSKGVLILAALVGARFGAALPLSLHASLVFEQSYAGVEGDSASLAEACALLSAIAQAPLRQSLAVTGSVNQHGAVQVVGGVNEKIEGFFDACRMRGLTGRQGVIIPEGTVPQLMLRDDVVRAAGEGRFHIHAVQTLDEAIALLTGLEAGVRDAQGAYPEGSLHARVAQRLRAFAEARQQFALQPSSRQEDKK
jgi:predicted ATP-dependent protease